MNASAPDKTVVSFLHALFDDASATHPDALIEIAHGKPEGGVNRASLFGLAELERAAEFAGKQNRAGDNVYVGAALRKPETPRHKRTKKDSVLAATWFAIEFDKCAAEGLTKLQTRGINPRIIVTTGTTPELRQHAWIRLSAPVDDISRIERALRILIDISGADPATKDAGRVMRCAGTYNYPNADKKKKKYLSEQTGFDVFSEAPAYSLEQILALEPSAPEPIPLRQVSSSPRPLSGEREENYARGGLENEVQKVASAPEGTRNDMLNKAAFAVGQMVGARWIGRGECADRLLEASRACGLSDIESKPTIERGLNAGEKTPRAPLEDALAGSIIGEGLMTKADRVVEIAPWRRGRERAGEAREEGFSSPPAAKFKLEPWADIKRDVNGEWLVKKLIPKTGKGTLFGKSQSFKSFGALSISVHVAAGLDWAGRRVNAASVVYIAAEGAAGVKKLIDGIRAAKPSLPSELPFYMVSAAPNLGTNAQDRNALIVSVEAVGVAPGLIVIDTLSMCLGGGEENGAGMQTLIGNAEALSNHFQCFVLIVHHVGHEDDERERGHSSSLGNMDARILCQRKEREMFATLTWKKLKDEECDFSLKIHMSRVVIDYDEDGEEISTLVVDSIEDAETKAKAPKEAIIPKARRTLMAVMKEAINEKGEPFETSKFGCIVRAVRDEIVRERYYARIAETPKENDTPKKLAERQRQSWNTAIKACIDDQMLAADIRDGERILWLQDPRA